MNAAINKTIMIVEDDPSIRDFIEIVLTKIGYEVMSVNDGLEMIRVATAKLTPKIDLILMDLMMPEKGGYSAIQELQSTPLNSVPVIVMTSKLLDKGAIELIRREPNVLDLWSKPLDPTTIRDKVVQVLARSAGNDNDGSSPDFSCKIRP